ncbi:hypothetical protein AAW00_13240 [Aurantiacibacter luteus]|uniref:Uncharacterized protein n=1 Tax=Aurantiacibacter luteus TaxID=1581420 RepID=A0A0G9MNV1_9SPHN|nr:hypothetical protein AAW00_13240 [Aurantiacibacter luteus]
MVGIIVLQKISQGVPQLFFMATFAFPDNHLSPPLAIKHRAATLVPLAIAFQLWSPKILPRLRHAHQLARRVWMLMPKTTVHENDLLATTEHKVRAAWKATVVQAIAIAHAMHQASDDHFGLRILLANAAHAFGSRFGGKSVHHQFATFFRGSRITRCTFDPGRGMTK